MLLETGVCGNADIDSFQSQKHYCPRVPTQSASVGSIHKAFFTTRSDTYCIIKPRFSVSASCWCELPSATDNSFTVPFPRITPRAHTHTHSICKHHSSAHAHLPRQDEAVFQRKGASIKETLKKRGEGNQSVRSPCYYYYESIGPANATARGF